MDHGFTYHATTPAESPYKAESEGGGTIRGVRVFKVQNL